MLASPTPLKTPRRIPGHARGPLPPIQTLPSRRPPSCSPLLASSADDTHAGTSLDSSRLSSPQTQLPRPPRSFWNLCLLLGAVGLALGLPSFRVHLPMEAFLKFERHVRTTPMLPLLLSPSKRY